QGDVVATLMPNLPEFAFLEFACAKIGAILCPINTRARTFELEHTLAHGEVRLLVMVDRFLKIDFVSILGELVPPGAVGAAGAVSAKAFPRLSRVVTLDGPGGEGRAQSWEAFLAGG